LLLLFVVVVLLLLFVVVVCCCCFVVVVCCCCLLLLFCCLLFLPYFANCERIRSSHQYEASSKKKILYCFYGWRGIVSAEGPPWDAKRVRRRLCRGRNVDPDSNWLSREIMTWWKISDLSHTDCFRGVLLLFRGQVQGSKHVLVGDE